MAKKNAKNETLKKAQGMDTEYSGNITPSAGRVKEAGYGKTTDLELADVETEGAGTQKTNRGIEGAGEINPLVTGIAKTNTHINENFELGNLNMGNNQLENDNAGLNTDYNDAPPSTGDTVGAGALHNLNEYGSQPDFGYEVGDLEKNERKPGEAENKK
jgi:hypothetical protein